MPGKSNMSGDMKDATPITPRSTVDNKGSSNSEKLAYLLKAAVWTGIHSALGWTGGIFRQAAYNSDGDLSLKRIPVTIVCSAFFIYQAYESRLVSTNLTVMGTAPSASSVCIKGRVGNDRSVPQPQTPVENVEIYKDNGRLDDQVKTFKIPEIIVQTIQKVGISGCAPVEVRDGDKLDSFLTHLNVFNIVTLLSNWRVKDTRITQQKPGVQVKVLMHSDQLKALFDDVRNSTQVVTGVDESGVLPVYNALPFAIPEYVKQDTAGTDNNESNRPTPTLEAQPNRVTKDPK